MRRACPMAIWRRLSRVGTALQSSGRESRVFGPRLCPPYAARRIQFHDVKQPGEWRIEPCRPYSLLTPSHSRDALRPGFEPFLCHPTRGGGAPRRRSGAAAPAACRSASKTRVNALLRGTPSACEAPYRPPAGGRAPLGAPPWRFLAGARASISGISSGSVRRAPRGQVVVPGGRGPGPPGAEGTSRSRGTPRLAPPTGPSPEGDWPELDIRRKSAYGG